MVDSDGVADSGKETSDEASMSMLKSVCTTSPVSKTKEAVHFSKKTLFCDTPNSDPLSSFLSKSFQTLYGTSDDDCSYQHISTPTNSHTISTPTISIPTNIFESDPILNKSFELDRSESKADMEKCLHRMDVLEGRLVNVEKENKQLKIVIRGVY